MTQLSRNTIQIDNDCCVIASLGKFDGLHLGHQSILGYLREAKRSLAVDQKVATVLIMFYPPPALVLGKTKDRSFLTSLRQILGLLEQFEIDHLVLWRFSKELSELSPEEFVDQYLIQKLKISQLVIGSDAAVGKDRKGDVDFLSRYLSEDGVGVTILDDFTLENHRISSSQIRSWITQGDLEKAGIALGRAHAVYGKVVRGAARGKQLGFPTANIFYGSQVVPANGVYICEVELEGDVYSAITNIGVRPTFGESKIQLETHILDYYGTEFYGKKIEVRFFEKIRDEMKFANVAELSRQILLDIQKCREYFE